MSSNPHPNIHPYSVVNPCSGTSRAHALLLLLLGGFVFAPAHAEIPPVCLDLYIEAGAVPVGPNASFNELLACKTTAAGAHTGMGTYFCTASSGSVYIDEYCGSICPADVGDIHLCFQDDDEDEDKEKCDRNSEGNPCNPASGNKHQTEVDYQSYGGRLSLVRHYHSLNPTDGPFGYGWSGTNQAHLAIGDADTLRVYQASGRSEPWQRVGGLWQGDPDSRLQLQAEGDGYVLDNPDLSVEHYDAQGRLISRTERGGQTTQYEYDNLGRLGIVTGPFGRTLVYRYNADGRVEGITTPDGELGYAYDTQGNLTQVTYPDIRSRHYHYEDPGLPHHLTGLTDERNQRLATWGYQADGRVISSEHAGGVERVTFDYSDNTTLVNGALGDSRTYTHQLLHGVRKITEVTGDRCDTCGNGDIQSRDYDADGFLSSYWDWNNSETRLGRNARHLIERRTEAFGTPQARVTVTEWLTDFDLPERVVEADRTTELDYYDDSHLLKSVRLIDNATGTSRTTAYTYNAQGQLASIDGPRTDVEDVTTYGYDGQGNLDTVTNARGQVTRITAHDASGRPLTVVDPNGLTTQLGYDPRGRMTTQSVSDGSTTRTTIYSYDQAGNLAQVDSPDGSVLKLGYDAAGRLDGLEDGLGNRVDFTLDDMGHPLESRITDPNGTLHYHHQQVYNRLGRLIESIDARDHITGYAYDDNGNLKQLTDARQNPTAQAYDALDRLEKLTDASNGVTQFAYDAQNNLTGVTDPNQLSTTYDYDGLGNLTEQTSPDTGVTSYSYDAAGNRVSQTDARNITAIFSYDALNRLTAIRYPDSRLDIGYSYDQGVNGIGRLTEMTDAHGTTVYSYNTFGQLLTKIHTASDGTVTAIGYTYDSAGRLASMSYPSGRMVRYGYNPQGQIESLVLEYQGGVTQILAENIQRLPFGPIQAYDYGNGLSLSRQFDPDYRLSDQTIPGILQSHYEYDPVGNVSHWQDLLDTGRDQGFDYDELNRLESAIGAYGELGYKYDPVGNRLSLTEGVLTETYSYPTDSHRLQEILGSASDTRHYDAVGNTIQSLIGTYTYDDTNRMVGFSKSGLDATYAYNGQGQRIRKHISQTGNADEYLALAAEAEARAQAYRDAADALEGEAQAGELEAERLNGEAGAAETAANQSTLAAGLLTLAAQLNNRWADAQDELGATLRQKAADYRSQILPNPATLLERLANAYYEGLAQNAETKALEADAKAVEFRAKADDYTVQAQAKQAEADSLTQQAASLRQQADALAAQALQQRDEAEVQRQLAAEADAQAAEYRRLADEIGTPNETTRLFAYDEQGLLIGEYDESGDPVREYVYLEGLPLALLTRDAQTQAEAVSYLHTDHLGAVVKVTNATQNLVWDAQRRPFGERTVITGQIEMPLGFSGQYFDQETGNYYNYFRDYDPAVGRYLESDPIGLNGGINTYAYVGGNPLLRSDRFGLLDDAPIPEIHWLHGKSVQEFARNYAERKIIETTGRGGLSGPFLTDVRPKGLRSFGIDGALTMVNTSRMIGEGNLSGALHNTYDFLGLDQFMGDTIDQFTSLVDQMRNGPGGNTQGSGDQNNASQNSGGSSGLRQWEDIEKERKALLPPCPN